jgi:hypothetical protein
MVSASTLFADTKLAERFYCRSLRNAARPQRQANGCLPQGTDAAGNRGRKAVFLEKKTVVPRLAGALNHGVHAAVMAVRAANYL